MTVMCLSCDVLSSSSSLGLAGFRAALKRSISAKREDSVSSGSVQPYKKQVSVMSQHTFQDDAFGDHTSLFSAEDIPVAASPSPFPTRRFPVESDHQVSQQQQQEEEEVSGREGRGEGSILC